uniref:G_PROTEIN_RECEP_F3_4 domain-containing protein n=1 Tax=Macrostomum lignano TaxID=282301 RepID=A0A1I8IXJ4_9PLAT
SIKDHQLAAVPLALVVLDVILFTVWALVDPMELINVKYAVVESIQKGSVEVNMAQTCHSNFLTIWLVTFVGYKGFLLAFGIFFAWETRAVHIESLNDSKKIGICVYNTMVMGALGVVMAFVLPASELNLRFLLINGCIIVCCTTAVVHR